MIKEFRGKKYKKVSDGEMTAKEACEKYCCFCCVDKETGERCCGNPNNIDLNFIKNNDPDWDGCEIGKFHWEEVK